MAPRGFSRRPLDLLDMAMKFVVNLQNGVGPGLAETAGVDEQDVAEPVTDGFMGVAVNYTIGFGEFTEETVFNVVVAVAIAMGKNYCEVVNGDFTYGWELVAGGRIAHIAVDGIQFLTLKSTEDGVVGKVAGMENY
jgi:hypothetical protein